MRGIVAALLMLSATIVGAPPAHADHDGATFEHECLLPDGQPNGWPCTHTELNGLKYIDWSYPHIPST